MLSYFLALVLVLIYPTLLVFACLPVSVWRFSVLALVFLVAVRLFHIPTLPAMSAWRLFHHWLF